MNDDRISLPELALRDAPFHGRYPMKSVMCLHMKQGWYREASSLLGDEAFFCQYLTKVILKGMEQ